MLFRSALISSTEPRLVLLLLAHVPSHAIPNAPIDDGQQMLVLQGRAHAFLVRQLLVDRSLTAMRPGFNLYTNLILWQTPRELGPEAEPNMCGHGTVWDRRCEADLDLLAVQGDLRSTHYTELLQCQGMLGILYVPNHGVDLFDRDRFWSGRRGSDR